jgi:hypothetical protein
MSPEIKKILYTTDSSTNSTYALRNGTLSAKLCPAEIIIMDAFETAVTTRNENEE